MKGAVRASIIGFSGTEEISMYWCRGVIYSMHDYSGGSSDTSTPLFCVSFNLYCCLWGF